MVTVFTAGWMWRRAGLTAGPVPAPLAPTQVLHWPTSQPDNLIAGPGPATNHRGLPSRSELTARVTIREFMINSLIPIATKSHIYPKMNFIRDPIAIQILHNIEKKAYSIQLFCTSAILSQDMFPGCVVSGC